MQQCCTRIHICIHVYVCIHTHICMKAIAQIHRKIEKKI
jgi:hypothetical protein